MTSAQIGDVRIEYVVDGPDDGEPMLLIMGMGAQLVAWPQDLVDLLVERGFRVVRYDNRDQGLSSFTDAPAPTRGDIARGLAARRLARSDYTLGDLAADAAGLLEHLGIASAHVVGASMGGMIAQELTVTRPEMVRSLCSIMSNTGHRRYGRTSAKLLPALLRQIRANPPRTRDEAVAASVEAFRVIAGHDFDADEMRLMAQAHVERGAVTSVSRDRQLNAINASPDRTPRLRRITAPTLVIHGLRDRLVLPSGGVATARAIPGSRLLVFPEMGHDLPRGRRVEMADAIATNAARAGSADSTRAADVRAIDGIVDEFFAAFSTGTGLDERMDRLAELFLPGARIVAAQGDSVRSFDVGEFIEPRRALLAEGGTLESFREWARPGRVEIFGDVAHWFGEYAKEGVQDGEAFTGRGGKSIQLVRTGGAWRISAAAWDDA
ncbi:alpha/beta fold hydrolase [Knoellia sp. LjRoot47]|uniref:alpha/beta fold hydrolase n=1 Tax=Knoellia sp. LjRoot47 TaxID=3342330 RepID=UPI003ECD2D2E